MDSAPVWEGLHGKLWLTFEPLHKTLAEAPSETTGAVLSFQGVVRGGGGVAALWIEADTTLIPTFMEREIGKLRCHESSSFTVVARLGRCLVGECVILINVQASHFNEAQNLLCVLLKIVKFRLPFWKAECFEIETHKWISPPLSTEGYTAASD